MTKFDMSRLPNMETVYAEISVTRSQRPTESNLFDHPAYRCIGTRGLPGEINVRIHTPSGRDDIGIYHAVRDALQGAGIMVSGER